MNPGRANAGIARDMAQSERRRQQLALRAVSAEIAAVQANLDAAAAVIQAALVAVGDALATTQGDLDAAEANVSGIQDDLANLGDLADLDTVPLASIDAIDGNSLLLNPEAGSAGVVASKISGLVDVSGHDDAYFLIEDRAGVIGRLSGAELRSYLGL